MAKLPLTTGGYATVDSWNLERLSQYEWSTCPVCGDIFRVVWEGAEIETIYLAAEVLGMQGESVYGACNPCPPLMK